ncbi:PREDICTED: histone-lysine N-methyltransferase SETMAR [Dufourea novaeangliae]|uniref:Histone-lysine N-methyltransferase SETMAR n=1 Tax=Dufourea novaeangliae TaxID=178035 RepID=A0A154PJM3_DUFNO|nr:PREDICTED: histone-lysine N-methyltransferase SETMAR [Dufourea novaeangliae]KZC11410.1 Histone-lysine N-methyltransferase SETMAR [Dufourea novaeangliae]
MEASACADEYEHSIPNVMYVVNNIPGPGIDLDDFESVYSLGCLCVDTCSNCSCTRGSPNYVDDRILDEKLGEPIIECNCCCTCGVNCGNRVIQKGPLDCLVVSKVGEKGLGLLTTKFIQKGQFICEYAGEVIGIEEARYRVEANKNDTNYVLVVSEHVGNRTIITCIDPKYFGNIGRYSNHSCEPNANLVPIRVEGVVPRLCLFASRGIDIGEEITFNYAGGVANSVHELSDTPCLCGSSNCVGYLPHNSI